MDAIFPELYLSSIHFYTSYPISNTGYNRGPSCPTKSEQWCRIDIDVRDMTVVMNSPAPKTLQTHPTPYHEFISKSKKLLLRTPKLRRLGIQGESYTFPDKIRSSGVFPTPFSGVGVSFLNFFKIINNNAPLKTITCSPVPEKILKILNSILSCIILYIGA